MRVSTPMLQVALDVFGLLLSLILKEIESRRSASVALGVDADVDTLDVVFRALENARDDLKAHI